MSEQMISDERLRELNQPQVTETMVLYAARAAARRSLERALANNRAIIKNQSGHSAADIETAKYLSKCCRDALNSPREPMQHELAEMRVILMAAHHV